MQINYLELFEENSVSFFFCNIGTDNDDNHSFVTEFSPHFWCRCYCFCYYSVFPVLFLLFFFFEPMIYKTWFSENFLIFFLNWLTNWHLQISLDDTNNLFCSYILFECSRKFNFFYKILMIKMRRKKQMCTNWVKRYKWEKSGDKKLLKKLQQTWVPFKI